MNNYAMIAINRKEDEAGKVHIRRVLISYKGRPTIGDFGIKYFHNTRLIAVDPYFEDTTRSHQYKFEDDGYTLISNDGPNAFLYVFKPELFKKRTYHILPHGGEEIWDYSEDKLVLTGYVRFKAKSDEEAIKIFHERKELR